MFEYTDPDGDHLTIAPRAAGDPIVSLGVRPEGGRTSVVHIPHHRVEEVVAGLRDAARTPVSTTPSAAAWPTLPRRFHLMRHRDVSGISGTGVVALGVRWPDGTASVRWLGDRPSIVFWDRGGMADAEHVHGHAGATEVVWDDEVGTDPLVVLQQIEEQPRYVPVPGCPHCPDGHTPPDHGQPWSAHVGPGRDGDGQPTTIHVGRSAGAHVAESDAEWVAARLNGREPSAPANRPEGV